MPSKSQAQQKFMGMVHALKKGEMDPKEASPELKKVAQSMKKSDAKDFASTKHKGLPKKVKQEILNKLKEYANKMGRDHLGGDDYTSSKKGGLRDFDGYDNVDYNKDMPMDEGMFSTIDHIRQNSKSVRDFIKNVLSDKDFRDMKNDKDFIKYLGSIYEGIEENFPANWMQGRTSDYHTKLRGKKRDYDATNFDKENSGQKDLEDEQTEGIHSYAAMSATRAALKRKKRKESVSESTKPDFNSKGYKEASKLVAKLRSSIFRKMDDHDLDQFRMVLAQAFDLKEGVNESGYSLDDLIGQVKTFNKPKTRKLLTIYVINKLKEKRNNSKSSSNKIKIQKLIDKIEGEYKKGKYLKEFGSRITEPFLLPKDEDKLDGTPPSKDAIDSDLEEEYKRDYKAEYKKFQSSTKAKKYRAELNKYNRQKGTYGNGDGKDASHKGGKIVGFESESKNRGRREKSRLRKK